MLRDNVVSLIAQRLGNRKNLNELIISELQLAQNMLESAEWLPWFLLTEIEMTTAQAQEHRVGLPLDFLLEYEEGALWYLDDQGKYHDLAKQDIDELTVLFESVSGHTGMPTVGVMSGPPQCYALVNQYYYIYPLPDQAYTLKTLYYGKDATLDTNIENRWLKEAPDLLMSMAGVNVAAFTGNTNAAQLFQANIEAARQSLYKKHEARAHTNREYAMGSN